MPNPEHDPRLLLLSPQDNVLVVCRPVAKGETVQIDGAAITIAADIQTGHKLARRAIAEAETITKYGAPIGVATLPIKPGEHVHIHNIRSDYTTSYSLAEAKAAFASARGGS